jgi:hypothetical protein
MAEISSRSGDETADLTPKLVAALASAIGGQPDSEDPRSEQPAGGAQGKREGQPPSRFSIPGASPMPSASAVPAASPIPAASRVPEISQHSEKPR